MASEDSDVAIQLSKFLEKKLDKAESLSESKFGVEAAEVQYFVE